MIEESLDRETYDPEAPFMNRRPIHEWGVRFMNRHYSLTGQSRPILKQCGSSSTGAACPFAATNAVLGNADGEKLIAHRR